MNFLHIAPLMTETLNPQHEHTIHKR